MPKVVLAAEISTWSNISYRLYLIVGFYFASRLGMRFIS